MGFGVFFVVGCWLGFLGFFFVNHIEFAVWRAFVMMPLRKRLSF